MADNRLELKVYAKLGAAAAAAFSAEYLASPFTKTVYAPYYSGYMLTGYQIGGGAAVTAGTIDRYTFTAQAASAGITFLYTAEAEYIASKFVTLTVKGSDGADTLYSYAKQVLKDTAADVGAAAIAGYVLDEGDGRNYKDGDHTNKLPGNFGTLAVSPAADSAVIFYFAKNKRDVKADAVYGGGSLPGYPQVIGTYTVGEAVTAYAPAIPGYQLAAGEPAYRKHTVVTNADNNAVTFSYVKSQGNVLFSMSTKPAAMCCCRPARP
jgi:hypothetical protein